MTFIEEVMLTEGCWQILTVEGNKAQGIEELVSLRLSIMSR